MSRFFSKLSARERKLALLTLGVMGVAALTVLMVGAVRSITGLEDDMARLEQELRNLAQQNAQRSSVEVAYRSVVQEHSSELSKQQIHDGLRREIFRLAEVVMPPKEGQPGRRTALVRIPTLREGQLDDRGEGYREYRIQFRIPSTRINNLMRFLERVEGSRVLRVDAVDLMRAPDSNNVQANLEITRTVLDSPDPGSGGRRMARAGAFGEDG